MIKVGDIVRPAYRYLGGLNSDHLVGIVGNEYEDNLWFVEWIHPEHYEYSRERFEHLILHCHGE